jgi:O-antigen/teichoic acid export membrane protein
MAESEQGGFSKEAAISGIGWNVVSRLGRVGLQFIIGVILSRLLSPADFGLVAMITVFTGFATIFMDLGFGSALIQKQDTRPEHYDSVFWLNMAAGLLLMGLFAAVAPLLAWLYDQPLLTPLTLFISTNFLITAFSSVQITLLQKQLHFSRLAYAELAALIISGVIAIAMALTGFGVWSLAVQTVLLSLLTVIFVWMKSGWRPSWRFSREAVRELIAFSSNLLGFNSLNYWLRNGDNFLVGRFLGTAELGIYSRAYSLMLLPLSIVSRTVGQVMFPAFSSIQSDPARVARIYLRMTRTIAFVTFPAMVGLWVVSPHFVPAIFGDQWLDMIPILRIFCLVGLLQSIGTLNGNLYLSQGRSDLQFRVGLVLGLAGLLAIVLGLRWGIEGVAMAYAIFSALAFYPSVKIAVSLVGLSFAEVVRNLGGVTVLSLLMGAILWTINEQVGNRWRHAEALLILTAAGAVIYGVVVHGSRLAAYQDVRQLLAEQRARRFSAVGGVAKSKN